MLGPSFRGLADNDGVHRMATVNVCGARSGAGAGTALTSVQWGPLVGDGRLAGPVHGHAQGNVAAQPKRGVRRGRLARGASESRQC